MLASDDMIRCGNCSSTFVRPVRPAWWERLRIRFSSLRPHECWHCGWRAWLPLEDHHLREADAATASSDQPARAQGTEPDADGPGEPEAVGSDRRSILL